MKFSDLFWRHCPVNIQNHYYRRKVLNNAEQWIETPFFLIHIPKCAGTSICKAMNLADPGHIGLQEFPQPLANILYQKPYLAIIREPKSRMLSTFKNIHTAKLKGYNHVLTHFARYKNINDFIDHVSNFSHQNHYFFRPGTELINSANECGANGAIVDFSQLDEGLSQFWTEIGFQPGEIPTANKSQVVLDLELDMSEKSIDWITAQFKADLETIKKLDGHAISWQ